MLTTNISEIKKNTNHLNEIDPDIEKYFVLKVISISNLRWLSQLYTSVTPSHLLVPASFTMQQVLNPQLQHSGTRISRMLRLLGAENMKQNREEEKPGTPGSCCSIL